MIKRESVKKLKLLAKEYGVVSVIGPRQSGKTTLVKKYFPHHEYFNLEDPSTLTFVEKDPKNFIESVKKGIIIDEIQKYPELLSYIQVAIDEGYSPAKYVLTGSQNLLLSEKVSQSLAGRVGILELLPLTISEMQNAKILPKNHLELILKGSYPRLYDKKQTVSVFYSNYLNTYVERDVRSIKNVGDLNTFRKFLQLLAGRVGQVLNLNELGGILGLDNKTAKSWISVLEASYIIYLLQPYHKNFGKRLIKSPKIYFVDTGLASYLLGLDSIKELETHFTVGHLFENLIISDFLKRKANSLKTTRFYFTQDSKGFEIDLILDYGTEKLPLEIKLSKTFKENFLKNIDVFKKLSDIEKGALIFTGESIKEIGDNRVLNYLDINDIKI